MTTRTLISGGGGFVGSFLAEGLLAAGHDVTVIDQGFDPSARNRLAGTRLIEADLSVGSVPELGGFDLVIHGAAITSADPALGLSEFDCLRANCAMTLAMLTLAQASGARDFVFLSSSGVFRAEDATGGILLESTPARASLSYAVAKRAGELLLEAAPMRAIAVRLGPVYGPHETARTSRRHVSPIRRWLDAGQGGAPIRVDIPGARRDWTYGPDLPGALLALLARQPAISGVVHLTSGEAFDDLDLAARIAAAYGVPVHEAPSGADIRLPMTSERVPPADLYAWTPLATGLSRLMEARP